MYNNGRHEVLVASLLFAVAPEISGKRSKTATIERWYCAVAAEVPSGCEGPGERGEGRSVNILSPH